MPYGKCSARQRPRPAQGRSIAGNSQLICGETGSHLWAERFDQAVANLFESRTDRRRLPRQLDATLAERAPPPDLTDMLFQGLARDSRS